MANKTYLELTFNDVLIRRYDVTHDSEEKIYSFIDNLLDGIMVEFRITNRKLKTGKIYDGKLIDFCNSSINHSLCI